MVEVKIDDKAVLRRVRSLGPKAIKEAKRTVSILASRLRRDVIRKRFTGYPGFAAARVHATSKLYNRSGSLKRSLQILGPQVSPNRVRSLVFFTSEVAPVQEFGAEIKPTGGRQFLTIPLEAALTASGVSRFGPRLIKKGGRFFTSDGDPTSLRKSKRGNLIIWITKGGKDRPLYILKRSVKIPPRLGFFDTWEDLRPFRREQIKELGRRIVKK